VEFPGIQDVETTTLGALMEIHGTPRYIKIDVEGHEAAVLRGLPRPVPFLSFEANLPEFLPEAAECVGILMRLCPAGCFNLTEACYRGLALGEWAAGPEMVAALRARGETSVEVFWRSEPARA